MVAVPVVAGVVPATATAAEAAPSAAVEDFAYPGAAKILAERNIVLKTGDGHIQLADCASGPGLLEVYSRAASPSHICFRVTGPTGYLAVEVPKVYNLRGDDHTVKATLKTAGAVTSIDVKKNDWTPVGESTGDATTLLELTATDGPAAPAAAADHPAVGTVTVGQPGRSAGSRACTATLVDRSWVLTAAGCFSDNAAALAPGAPPVAATAAVGGQSVGIVELVPRTDRDLVMARLANPVDGVTPAVLAATAPAVGESLRVPGFGRTAADWAPFKQHTTTHTAGAVSATGIETAPAAGAASICAGDAGAPLLRERNGGTELVAVASRSWQGGCLGSTETRTGASSTRTDDIAGWVQQVRATAFGWKTQVLVKGGTNLYHATRLYDGSWTPFEDVQSKAGNIGGVRSSATAGIDRQTHVLAVGGNGRLYHALREPDGSWSSFGDLTPNAGALGEITQVAATSIGPDLHVVVVADGQLYHTVRVPSGYWTAYGRVLDATGPLNGITSLAATSVGTELQVAAVSDGKAFHTQRDANGYWGTWGSLATSAGATGPVNAVAMARQGNDVNLAVITDGGTKAYHTVRYADGTWHSFLSLNGVLGQITATSISGAIGDGDFQFVADTGDNRVLTTARLADGNWSPLRSVDLQGLAGSHTGTTLTGTW
ncbi:trypsin-like serine protease [Kitasatospora sp. NPDC058170]|uniref:trypsin-like serine protease n=1 Tax=Kitasatospora sp. NPDC058170 TaxID=3346364 RepID=UPI0036D9B2BB